MYSNTSGTPSPVFADVNSLGLLRGRGRRHRQSTDHYASGFYLHPLARSLSSFKFRSKEYSHSAKIRVKWLRYVGWALYGVEGQLSRDSECTPLRDEETVNEDDEIRLAVPDFVPSATVDADVLAHRSQSGRTNPLDRRVTTFREDLQRRDCVCIFTGWTGEARHIIPFARGTEWLHAIAHARSMTPSLYDINDIQNGFICQADLHRLLDKKQLAVLFTPNPVLQCDDIAANPLRSGPLGYNYPTGCRYILQNLHVVNSRDVLLIQRLLASDVLSADGCFQELNQSDLPHPELLHYVYGISVLEAFGSAQAWRDTNAPWFRPKPQSQEGGLSDIPPTIADHENVDDERYGQPSSTQVTPEGDEGGYVRFTPGEAEDYVFRLWMMQAAQREQAERQLRNRDIEQWTRACVADPETSP
ncbi:hypothetical protein GLOTRDRAFT_125084 [Gloeophyllum trabeum ATCC 11539]|uniref:HNH nuclease domain-containing protein n=1 Tax=Gloeophyllum trabeum (strain ATCC 11539 / FP-39264 / Madison 617) TaxID=670483 RepID=S7QPP9_GLOTA|nr:uncharacterized protein GLOTRDRAFT_125084 [Gloeophyllum trabeum ATCC 11539]EPQ61367.1 hypothetical protein GLOTRDRAFT_125084 [Gloeophyllum trabeum ATCC 11539]